LWFYHNIEDRRPAALWRQFPAWKEVTSLRLPPAWLGTAGAILVDQHRAAMARAGWR
jgi:hypothetical protein